eukprot:651364-Pleurochrysis_carterae.AAC.3
MAERHTYWLLLLHGMPGIRRQPITANYDRQGCITIDRHVLNANLVLQLSDEPPSCCIALGT